MTVLFMVYVCWWVHYSWHIAICPGLVQYMCKCLKHGDNEEAEQAAAKYSSYDSLNDIISGGQKSKWSIVALGNFRSERPYTRGLRSLPPWRPMHGW